MTATAHQVGYLALPADDAWPHWGDRVQCELYRENMAALCIAVVPLYSISSRANTSHASVLSSAVEKLLKREAPRGYDWHANDRFVTVWNTALCKCEDFQFVPIVGDEDVHIFTLIFVTEQTVKINCANGSCARASSHEYIEALIPRVPRPCLIGGVFNVDKIDLSYYMDDPEDAYICLLYTSPSPRDGLLYRMPSSA